MHLTKEKTSHARNVTRLMTNKHFNLELNELSLIEKHLVFGYSRKRGENKSSLCFSTSCKYRVKIKWVFNWPVKNIKFGAKCLSKGKLLRVPRGQNDCHRSPHFTLKYGGKERGIEYLKERSRFWADLENYQFLSRSNLLLLGLW